MERHWDSRCKFCRSFVVAALLLCSSKVPATLARIYLDFLNIDCGSTITYLDPVTSYVWVPDTTYISTGKLHSLVVPTSLQNFTEFKDLRYFDDLRPKNCFTLPVVSGSTYLLRATFFYGNYDNKNQPPSFQMALDGSVMDNVTAPSGESATYVEYHYVAQGSESILCLLRTSPDETPFISGISLKLAAPELTKGYAEKYGQLLQEGRVMKTGVRVNYGETKVIRAPEDFYDRWWFPETPDLKLYLSPTPSPTEFLSTTSPFPDLVDQDYLPPSFVMQTAVTSNGTLSSMLFYRRTPKNTTLGSMLISSGTSNNDKQLYVSICFAELIQYTGTPLPRNFTINALGGFRVIDIYGLYMLRQDFYNSNYTVGENSTMTMAPIAGTLNGPILNAMEVFVASDPRMTKTIRRDALAIEDIKEKWNLTTWTGDPCLPIPHSWIGCILPNVTTLETQITSMNLSRYHLMGSIPDSFANFSTLTNLSLENNNLSGQLPEFLTTLTNLRVLSIQNNNFSGFIPKALLAKNSPILFTYRPGNPLLVAPSVLSKKSSNVGAIAGATIGGIWGFILILVIAIFAHRRCKRKAPSLTDDEGAHIMKIATPGAAKAYSRAEVNVATNNLNRELGRGGFGPVYYGILPDGKEVAVKVADKSSKQGEKEFFNEVDVLSRVHHKNLVALVGYCQEHDSILLYEYMPNGSLFDHLHGTAGKGSTLNWKSRLHIGLNAAQGLEYLHAGCCPSFIHRDVKSGNILLTPKFDAKVSDFGLTRLMGESEDTRVLTDVMGTAGYLDPEYYVTQYLHTKSDVYSFGIVLLELITGRLPIDQSMTALGENPHIVHWARESLQNNFMDSILAPAVKASNPNMGAVWKFVDIAMQSVEPQASHRPSMTQVVHELQGALALEGGPIAGSEFYSGNADNCSTGPSSFPMPR